MLDEFVAGAAKVAEEGTPAQKVAFIREAAAYYDLLGNEEKAKELRRVANLYEALHRSGKI